jgi:hypothetical protein
LKAALSLLSIASAYADDVGCDVWEFAVGWETLHDRQVAPNDLRWLVRKGYVDHRIETTRANSERRRFRAPSEPAFSSLNCFVLTTNGLPFARAMLIESSGCPADLPSQASPPNRSVSVVPLWDRNRRMLCLGDEIVKHFRVPAGNQEVILASFEEEGWPPSIDDPLPPANQIDAKRRLRDTISRLNHHQRHPLLHFFGNGNGCGVCWQIAIAVSAKCL